VDGPFSMACSGAGGVTVEGDAEQPAEERAVGRDNECEGVSGQLRPGPSQLTLPET